MNKPNCYECIHRRNIPGDCHSSCAHPSVGDMGDNPLGVLFALLGGKRMNNDSSIMGESLHIKGNAHGIKNGWFCWPFNFDPVWLENCEGFTPKNKVDTSS